jgi:glycosyltransferase involved in cell wall biosynthesis
VRIGVLTTSYPRAEDDPAGEFVAGFARWLAARADVEVLCAAADRRLFYRGGAPLALQTGRWPEAAAFSARLLAEAAVRRWDAVVSHWLVPCGAVGMLLGRPHLAIAHGSDVRLLRRLPGGRRLARMISQRADLVYVAEHLQIDGAPGRVVPMGVDAAAWQGGDREGTRRMLGLDGFTLLFLGRLIPEKGAHQAIAALPEGVELLIAGDGPERARLEKQAGGRPNARVRFLGEVRGAKKRDLLAAADALVVASPPGSEGSPMVLAEAAAAGLPAMDLARDPHMLRRLPEAPARLQPSGAKDWSVIGPRLAGRLPLGSSPGSVHVKRM